MDIAAFGIIETKRWYVMLNCTIVFHLTGPQSSKNNIHLYRCLYTAWQQRHAAAEQNITTYKLCLICRYFNRGVATNISVVLNLWATEASESKRKISK